MKLSEQSYEWAINHLQQESDTDLFPKPLEIDIIAQEKCYTLSKIKDIDLGNYEWNSYRRFIIPKGELSYRIVTQLSPMDSIIISSIFYEYGQKIEDKRVPISDKKVFSYRFSPETNGSLYSNMNSWGEFWNHCRIKAETYEFVACLDISDFYNQIYHHTIENRLIDSEMPNVIITAIMKLIEFLTQKLSRGVPVGPHFSHLIAEMSLIPIDENMILHGIEFCRYADDIIIFSNSETDIRAKIYKIAEILDKEQRLVLQRQKTKLYTRYEFLNYADIMIKDNPLDIQEEEMINIISRYSDNNPYAKINYNNLTLIEQEVFSKEKIELLIQKYMSKKYPDYPRLRWFFRRLSQIGAGEAVDYCILNMERLIPAISDVCQYLVSASTTYSGDWAELGKKHLNYSTMSCLNQMNFSK